jgi:hypothetical protein
MRSHHYTFAHGVIQDYVAAHPLQFITLMVSPDRDDFVAWLWEQAARYVGSPISGIDISLTAVACREVSGYPVVFIRLPPPTAIAEAICVAIVGIGAEEGERYMARYILLEAGVDSNNNPRTVLCEWAAGVHSNYGDGPEPELEAFVEAVKNLL